MQGSLCHWILLQGQTAVPFVLRSMGNAWRNILTANISMLFDFCWRNASRKWQNTLQRTGAWLIFSSTRSRCCSRCSCSFISANQSDLPRLITMLSALSVICGKKSEDDDAVQTIILSWKLLPIGKGIFYLITLGTMWDQLNFRGKGCYAFIF